MSYGSSLLPNDLFINTTELYDYIKLLFVHIYSLLTASIVVSFVYVMVFEAKYIKNISN